jgi:hypothetical protein
MRWCGAAKFIADETMRLTDAGISHAHPECLRAYNCRLVNQNYSLGGGQMALYESDHTKFMREMMAIPNGEDQRRGRAIWWDRKVDLSEQSCREANEPQDPYDVNFEQ